MKLLLLLFAVHLFLTTRVVRGGVCRQRYYPHPTDCQKYLDCPYGNNVLTCPDKQQWNPLQQYCDWAYNVKCKKGPKVYLTKTALNKNLEISWLEADRATLPGDKIILRKYGNYITEINPSKHAQNYKKTDIALKFKTLDLEDSLEQECFGDYTVEWRDQSKEIIAEGCLKSNPKWMEENADVMKDVNVGNLILTGTQYSGMYSAKRVRKPGLRIYANFPFNFASPVLLTDPKCSIWGIACPDHFKSYLNSKPDNLLLQYLFYRINCQIWNDGCPASYLNQFLTPSDDDLFANFMSLIDHDLISLVLLWKPYLYSMYTEYLRTFLTAFALPFADCPIEEMFEEEIENTVKSYILPRFRKVFQYIQDNWVLHHHENILEQLVLGVRYQDIRLLYDESSDSKFLMGKGCFKGPSLNEGLSQLKMFLKSTKELVFWEINIEETGSNYICGENSLQWDVDVVEQFVDYLKEELSEWLLKPNDNIIVEKSIWKTPYKNIFNNQNQGRIVLITKEQKFIEKNLFFPPRNTEKLEKVSYHTKINQSISPAHLYNSIADYKKGRSFDFEASLTPSILDFSPTVQSGINSLFDFLDHVLNDIFTIIPNIYKELPVEVIKQFWELIDTSIENLFGVMGCIFGDITGPLKDFIEDISKFFKLFFGDKLDFFTTLFGDKLEIFTKLFGDKLESFTKLFGDKLELFTKLFGDKLEFFEKLFGDKVEFFENLFNPVIKQINHVTYIIDEVTDLIDDIDIFDIFRRRKRRDIHSSKSNTTDNFNMQKVNTSIFGIRNKKSIIEVVSNLSPGGNVGHRKRRNIDSSKSNATENLKMQNGNTTISGIRNKRSISITDIISKLSPGGIFGQCKKDLMKIIPAPWTLMTPFTNLGLTPMKLLFEKYSQEIKSYKDMIQPYCRYIVQFEIDLLISKLMTAEIIQLPLDILGITKVKFEPFLNSILTVIARNQDKLPGLKQLADDVNFHVTKNWRKNSDELSDVFVSLHTYITGTNMIQENIERLMTKIDG